MISGPFPFLLAKLLLKKKKKKNFKFSKMYKFLRKNNMTEKVEKVFLSACRVCSEHRGGVEPGHRKMYGRTSGGHGHGFKLQ